MSTYQCFQEEMEEYRETHFHSQGRNSNQEISDEKRKISTIAADSSGGHSTEMDPKNNKGVLVSSLLLYTENL